MRFTRFAVLAAFLTLVLRGYVPQVDGITPTISVTWNGYQGTHDEIYVAAIVNTDPNGSSKVDHEVYCELEYWRWGVLEHTAEVFVGSVSNSDVIGTSPYLYTVPTYLVWNGVQSSLTNFPPGSGPWYVKRRYYTLAEQRAPGGTPTYATGTAHTSWQTFPVYVP